MNIGKHSAEITLLGLILTFLLVWFGLKPFLAKLNDLNAQLTASKKEYSQKEEKVKALSEIKNKAVSLKDELSLMQKALPKEADVPGILVATESIVGASGLSFSSFQPPTQEKTSSAQTQSSSVPPEEMGASQAAETMTQSEGVNSLSFTLDLTGDYPQFLDFLRNVERNIRPIAIRTISISGAKENKPASLKIKLTTYYQKTINKASVGSEEGEAK